jgi:hypothetical protein
MGDSEQGSAKPGIPGWQKSQSDPPDATPAASEGKLDVARRFLEDEQVKSSSRESKIEFLRSKGLETPEIQNLLDEGSSESSTEVRCPRHQSPTNARPY